MVLPFSRLRWRFLQWAPFFLISFVSFHSIPLLVRFFLWSASPRNPPQPCHPWQPAPRGRCPSLPWEPAAGQGVLESAKPRWVDLNVPRVSNPQEMKENISQTKMWTLWSFDDPANGVQGGRNSEALWVGTRELIPVGSGAPWPGVVGGLIVLSCVCSSLACFVNNSLSEYQMWDCRCDQVRVRLGLLPWPRAEIGQVVVFPGVFLLCKKRQGAAWWWPWRCTPVPPDHLAH